MDYLDMFKLGINYLLYCLFRHANTLLHSCTICINFGGFPVFFFLGKLEYGYLVVFVTHDGNISNFRKVMKCFRKSSLYFVYVIQNPWNFLIHEKCGWNVAGIVAKFWSKKILANSEIVSFLHWLSSLYWDKLMAKI